MQKVGKAVCEIGKNQPVGTLAQLSKRPPTMFQYGVALKLVETAGVELESSGAGEKPALANFAHRPIEFTADDSSPDLRTQCDVGAAGFLGQFAEGGGARLLARVGPATRREPESISIGAVGAKEECAVILVEE